MATISLCMIVKNEERFIGQCIESVKGLVDEVIVVDTGSSDKTKGIAKGAGARVFDYEWDNNTSNARNFSISKASSEWILVLDADETLSEKDFEGIRELIKKDVDGYSLIQRNYTNNEFLLNFVSCEGDSYEEGGSFKGFVSVPIVRLFRNDKNIFYEREAHEVVEHSIMRKGGKIIATNIPIHHFKELKGEEIGKKKIEHYAKLSKKTVKVNPLDAKAYFDIGLAHFKNKEHDKAIKYYELAIKANPKWVEPYFGLSEVYGIKGDYNKCVEINKKIIELNPSISAAYYNLGELYVGLGMYPEAIKSYEKALELGSPLKKRIEEILPQLRDLVKYGKKSGGYNVSYGFA